jgi:AAA domain
MDDTLGVPPPSAEWQASHPGWDKPPDAPIWINDRGWDEAALPRRPWVAPGFLLRRTVTLLAGAPSAFKSSLLLGWASAITLYRDFGRFRPAVQGRVIVYNTEDDDDEQCRRLSAVLRQFNATPDDAGPGKGQKYSAAPSAGEARAAWTVILKQCRSARG